MMYKTIPLQLFAAVALLAARDVEGFVPAPLVRGHLASAGGRGATCSQGVKPLQAGAMGENTPEEDKIKARAAFADSSLMDNLMNMLNQLRASARGGTALRPSLPKRIRRARERLLLLLLLIRR